MSTHSAPAQRLPAWKRLGLKLKGSASDESPANSNSSVQASPRPNALTHVNGSSPASALKRKLPDSAASYQSPTSGFAQTPNKKLRRDDQASDRGTPSGLRRQKSVTFTEDTKITDPSKTTPAKTIKPAKPKREKKPKKASESAFKPDFSLEPALSYIRQWHTARDSWKFNKNHQTLLIKYLFDGDRVPSSDIPIFYEYVRDLKGAVRTRLRETATEIKKKDMEQGEAAFPASTKDKETKQKQYEEVISRFLEEQQLHHEQNGGGSSSSANANGKRSFDEVELVLRAADPEVKQRLLKRIRAEMVLESLSDSEDTTSTETTTTTATASSGAASSSSGGDALAADRAAAQAPAPAKRAVEASQQPAKRRRLRDVRTAIDDNDDTSSDDSSDDDDDDDDDSDEEMELTPNQNAAETSSSSSSSSSSSGSDSEPADADDDSDDDDEED
ncbi:hypothetical protein B0T26DRAFT_636196 [Lasiosphaeria miniovina]|uniref:WKF domain-containing protein n=1 Tax=Lasiosphaeria miniovina TaxID=1954250 RepID=A0AA40E952_9PEZI|nr:uncharacterized protein B0T26DRAFT_636196 [Lasiosphaeria miniovina]KAK0726948.1 hypothetical protein B0T26DRAFT_636196 [Lasiosphaeria miniovina]